MKKLNKAVGILAAAFFVNMCIGIIYAWSVFKQSLVEQGWSNTDASMPYTVATICLAVSLLIAGHLQDKIGPRKVLLLGTVLCACGLIISSFVRTPFALIISFGVITGSGIGFAYSCLSAATMKWFHPSRKGFVNGLVVSGYGLAAVYLAPLTSQLIESYNIHTTFLILGIAVFLITVPLASFITNPPADYQPAVPAGFIDKKQSISTCMAWPEMLKTHQFYFLWFMFTFASASGLMIIGNITSIAIEQAQLAETAFLVVLIAIFNSAGRLGGGILCDKIGAVKTLTVAILMQCINMVLFAFYDSSLSLSIGAVIAGTAYGALLSIFPSVTAEYYGLKNYGGNFGVLFTAWGVSGIVGPILAAIMVDRTGNYDLGYLIFAISLGICLVLSLLTKPVQKKGGNLTILNGIREH